MKLYTFSNGQQTFTKEFSDPIDAVYFMHDYEHDYHVQLVFLGHTYSMCFTWRRSRAHNVLMSDHPALDGWLNHMLDLNWDFPRAMQYNRCHEIWDIDTI